MRKRAEEPRKAPLTVEEAIKEIASASTVAGLAHTAALDLAGEIAIAKAVRLTREVLRLTERYGADAPETRAAADRIEEHAEYAAVLKFEQARAAVPIPDSDPDFTVVYGRVLHEDGTAASGLVVEPPTRARTAPVAPCPTDADGVYQVKVPSDTKKNVSLRVVDPKTKSVVATTEEFRAVAGVRAYLEIFLPPTKASHGTCGTEEPPTTSPVMPDVVGMSRERAEAVLEKLGVARVTAKNVSSEKPQGEVIAQSPKAGTKLKKNAEIDLAVSLGAAIVVPQLVRRTLEEATLILNQAGLALGETDGDPRRGRVSDQSPDAGRKVRSGTKVNLKLTATQPPPTPQPPTRTPQPPTRIPQPPARMPQPPTRTPQPPTRTTRPATMTTRTPFKTRRTPKKAQRKPPKTPQKPRRKKKT